MLTHEQIKERTVRTARGFILSQIGFLAVAGLTTGFFLGHIVTDTPPTFSDVWNGVLLGASTIGAIATMLARRIAWSSGIAIASQQRALYDQKQLIDLLLAEREENVPLSPDQPMWPNPRRLQ